MSVKPNCLPLSDGAWGHGFIQSADSGDNDVKAYSNINPKKYIYAQSWTQRYNDAPLNHALYRFSTAQALGNDFPDEYDSPGLPKTFLHGGETYTINSPNRMKLVFTVWQVVVCSDTQTHVPLLQQSWSLDFNTAGAFPLTWKVDIKGSPAAVSLTPTDPKTTSDTVSEMQGPKYEN